MLPQACDHAFFNLLLLFDQTRSKIKKQAFLSLSLA
jgi:hypothetical protein